jgi:hypothetical protein
MRDKEDSIDGMRLFDKAEGDEIGGEAYAT